MQKILCRLKLYRFPGCSAARHQGGVRGSRGTAAAVGGRASRAWRTLCEQLLTTFALVYEQGFRL